MVKLHSVIFSKENMAVRLSVAEIKKQFSTSPSLRQASWGMKKNDHNFLASHLTGFCRSASKESAFVSDKSQRRTHHGGWAT